MGSELEKYEMRWMLINVWSMNVKSAPFYAIIYPVTINTKWIWAKSLETSGPIYPKIFLFLKKIDKKNFYF